ncbi:S-layer homology domain-containing protein [Sporomusa termitida]|uniref:S-layer homology domain protein n=1 Tax=Sporomusa termitida TaxID=2377 RepID=A0A517DXH3_9FIRM|nr:S-layer homology domain-containing protein [Sporomusa termitida]QDR82051.1 S-layer homology domain protein [Sporomusa termitida]
MKQQTALALAAVFALSVAGTALAAPANPFVDVPAKHWAYDSVSKLAQAGIISGYGDGTYRGDRTLTRYEMATIVGKALANSEKADAEIQKELDALQAEFADELYTLGVRVDEIEKKVDNTKLTGVIRARFDDNDILGTKTQDAKLRTRIMVTGKISDDWTYNARLQNVQNLKSGGNDDSTVLNIANVTGKVGDATVTVGRYSVLPAYGIVIDDQVDGGMVSFGNKLKVDLAAYKFGTVATADLKSEDTIYMANLGYALNDKANVRGAYFHNDDGAQRDIFEVGLDYKLVNNLVVSGAYAKEDVDKNDSYFVKLAYKGAAKNAAGSYGVYGMYREVNPNTYFAPTFDQDFAGKNGDGKGYEVGFTYTPMKNALLTTTYTDLDGLTDKNENSKYYRAQVEFYF